jgi:Zn-dependent peptidase ImmA (M78 family)
VLGHAVLHPRANTPFLKANTFFSVERIEREANEFAVELLMPDTVVREYQTIYEAAAACGVPEEVVRLKRVEDGWVRNLWHDERSFLGF